MALTMDLLIWSEERLEAIFIDGYVIVTIVK